MRLHQHFQVFHILSIVLTITHQIIHVTLDVEGNEPEGFQVITEGSNEDDSNSSTGDAWARIHELSTELQEKLLSFREERCRV